MKICFHTNTIQNSTKLLQYVLAEFLSLVTKEDNPLLIPLSPKFLVTVTIDEMLAKFDIVCFNILQTV
mgnify:CR=1 FL=1